MIKLHDTNYVFELPIQLSRVYRGNKFVELFQITLLLVWKFMPVCTLIALKQLN